MYILLSTQHYYKRLGYLTKNSFFDRQVVTKTYYIIVKIKAYRHTLAYRQTGSPVSQWVNQFLSPVVKTIPLGPPERVSWCPCR